MTIALTWPRLPAGPDGNGTIHADRLGWAGPAERALHAPRLERLRGLALSTELALIVAGAIEATVLIVDMDHLAVPIAQATAAGLVVAPLAARRAGAGPDATVHCTLLVTTPAARAAVIGVIASGDEEAIARAFGFPACCAQALAARRGAGSDPMLAMLAGGESKVSNAHLLLPALGVGALRHLPCSADCGPTHDMIERFVAAARALDAEAGGWLEQLGAWPVTWSAVGGIAEVWTRYFRYHHPVGAGACRVVANPRPARAAAPRDPRFGAVIERLLPAREPAPPETLGLPQDWQRAGFDNPFALRARYAGLLWQWGGALRGGAGDVLHYPCGDGLLGEMLAGINPRLRFHGVDDDPAALALARARLPSPHHEFALAPPGGGTNGRAAFLDPEPLLARGDRAAQEIRAALGRHALVVVYASDRGLRRFGSVEALAHAAGLSIDPESGTMLSARVTA